MLLLLVIAANNLLCSISEHYRLLNMYVHGNIVAGIRGIHSLLTKETTVELVSFHCSFTYVMDINLLN